MLNKICQTRYSDFKFTRETDGDTVSSVKIEVLKYY